MKTILLGPILGYETGADGNFVTCLFVADGAEPCWRVGEDRSPFVLLGTVAGGALIWRAEWRLPDLRPAGRLVPYSIELDGQPAAWANGQESWSFYVPASAEYPRFAYGSCNGFSSAKLMAATADPHAMWNRLRSDHDSEPLSLIVLGGDQIYADAIWEQPWMKDFAELTETQMATAPVTAEMEREADGFYERLYLRQWNAAPVARMLASVPSIMMWDDHDIFDGWGSHPAPLQACRVYRRIYQSALRAFALFQLRGNRSRGFLAPGSSHFAYEVRLNAETILMLDHRTERSLTSVMSTKQWADFKAWLAAFSGTRLFVQSAVPVVYRTFGMVERALAATDSREELEDDLNDHWTAREHQQERLRLIYSLIERQKEVRDQQAVKPQWFFLSGDVHVGCMGSVWETNLDVGLYQVVASGIVHPAPSFLAWLGICAVSGDGDEKLGNGDLITEIHQIAGARAKFIRSRNYARLELGPGKVWINWRCENEDAAVFCV